MSKNRKNYSAQQKVAILRKHLLENVPISDLCEQHNLNPTVFYRWQKQFFENGAAAFSSLKEKPSSLQARVSLLEQKLVRKNEVLSHLMEEHIKLKKEFGEL